MRQLLILTGILGLTGCSFLKGEPDFESRLKKDYPSYHLKKKREYSSAGVRAQEFEGRPPGSILKFGLFSNINLSQAQTLIDVEKAKIESLKNTKPIPYFSVISQKAQCPLAEKIQIQSSPGNLSAHLAANERENFDVCEPEKIAYDVHIQYLFCSDLQLLLAMTVFFQKSADSAANIPPQVSCATFKN
jgi:hypothetical protein